jgi:hypothetical protein
MKEETMTDSDGMEPDGITLVLRVTLKSREYEDRDTMLFDAYEAIEELFMETDLVEDFDDVAIEEMIA